MIKVNHKSNKKSTADSAVKHKRIKKSESQVFTFDRAQLKADLMKEAKVLGMAESTAETIVSQVVDKVSAWTEKRAAMTLDDLNRQVAKEMKKFNADLAYVYQNRGKII